MILECLRTRTNPCLNNDTNVGLHFNILEYIWRESLSHADLLCLYSRQHDTYEPLMFYWKKWSFINVFPLTKGAFWLKYLLISPHIRILPPASSRKICHIFQIDGFVAFSKFIHENNMFIKHNKYCENKKKPRKQNTKRENVP